MTDQEKQEILEALLAESTDLTGLPVAQSLIDVTCLPALQGDSLVRAPVSLLAEPALLAAARADAATDASDDATRQANAAALAARNATARTNEATTAADEATRQANAATLAARNATGEANAATEALSGAAERASGAAEAANTAAGAATEAASEANTAAAAASLAARTMIMPLGGMVQGVSVTEAVGVSGGEVVYDTVTKRLYMRTRNGALYRYYNAWPDREAWCSEDGTPLPGKLYIDTTRNVTLRWDGTDLVEVGRSERVVCLTEAAYDALEPDDNIIYMIYEDD